MLDVTTSFQDTHVNFGLAPCWGLLQQLNRWIRPGHARLVLLMAHPVNAHVAYQWGLLDDLINDLASSEGVCCNPVLDRAIKMANAIAANDSLMV
ncbi:hypothetical protein ACHAXA_006139 [Cyclostephanos tholiformis]|uniref:Uncharacterized protein n=1 Tax=Cyclostephanos tholiformis TaxID=382380 RepID=A0ABD3RAI2_9STRA